WLTRDEADWLTDTIEAENRAKLAHHGKVSFLRSLAGIRTLSLSFIYYSKSVAIYVLAFFTPSIISGLGDRLSNTAVGFITAIPYAAAAIFMVWWARHSDRDGERRWHVGIPLLVAAAGLVSMVFVQDSLWFSVILLVVITVAVYATYGPFWALPSLFLTGPAAAVGLASINSLANLGGFVGPFGFGALETATGSIYWGLTAVSITLVIAA
ncbi:MFS transporter, partial [Rhodococcus sp. WS4]